jgi:hypothetical protein
VIKTTVIALLLLSINSSIEASSLDEQFSAKAALEVAEEELQSLCASHAETFISVEQRGPALSF